MDHKVNQSRQGLKLTHNFFKKKIKINVFTFLTILSKVAGQTARVLIEFLEVAITAIVFLKGVYPSG